jgi:hypothetical protein
MERGIVTWKWKRSRWVYSLSSTSSLRAEQNERSGYTTSFIRHPSFLLLAFDVLRAHPRPSGRNLASGGGTGWWKTRPHPSTRGGARCEARETRVGVHCRRGIELIAELACVEASRVELGVDVALVVGLESCGIELSGDVASIGRSVGVVPCDSICDRTLWVSLC